MILWVNIRKSFLEDVFAQISGYFHKYSHFCMLLFIHTYPYIHTYMYTWDSWMYLYIYRPLNPFTAHFIGVERCRNFCVCSRCCYCYLSIIQTHLSRIIHTHAHERVHRHPHRETRPTKNL